MKDPSMKPKQLSLQVAKPKHSSIGKVAPLKRQQDQVLRLSTGMWWVNIGWTSGAPKGSREAIQGSAPMHGTMLLHPPHPWHKSDGAAGGWATVE